MSVRFSFSINCIELKKILLGENIERLLLIGQMPDTTIAISDYGVTVQLVTQFGEVQTLFDVKMCVMLLQKV